MAACLQMLGENVAGGFCFRVPFGQNYYLPPFARPSFFNCPINHYGMREIFHPHDTFNRPILTFPQNVNYTFNNHCVQENEFDVRNENIGTPLARNEHQFKRNEVIATNNRRYIVDRYSGRGTFGQVVIVWEQQTQQYLALKMLRRDYFYTQQGMIEISLLKRVNQTIGEHVVNLVDSFEHIGHMCLVFELLERDLYDFVQNYLSQPLFVMGIRAITYQLLKVLVKLKEIGIIHADLKPENIMIVNQKKWPFYVKIIDFGSAFENSAKKNPTYIQSRCYRAPEVILGCEFDFSIDVWSLGCIMGELVTGWALFPGSNQYEQIRYILRACGPFSQKMISSGKNSSMFFKKKNIWKIMSKNEYWAKSGITVKSLSRYSMKDFSTISTKLLKNFKFFENSGYIDFYKRDIEQFIVALKEILIPDPEKRPSAENIIKSPFWNFKDYIPVDSKWFYQSSSVMYTSKAWSCKNVPINPYIYNDSTHINQIQQLYNFNYFEQQRHQNRSLANRRFYP